MIRAIVFTINLSLRCFREMQPWTELNWIDFNLNVWSKLSHGRSPKSIYSSSCCSKYKLYFLFLKSIFLLNKKEYILKNVGNQTVDVSNWLQCYFFHTMKLDSYRQLIDYQYSSKYLLLCLTAERIIHTGLKQVEGDRTVIFGGTISLICKLQL